MIVFAGVAFALVLLLTHCGLDRVLFARLRHVTSPARQRRALKRSKRRAVARWGKFDEILAPTTDRPTAIDLEFWGVMGGPENGGRR